MGLALTGPNKTLTQTHSSHHYFAGAKLQHHLPANPRYILMADAHRGVTRICLREGATKYATVRHAVLLWSIQHHVLPEPGAVERAVLLNARLFLQILQHLLQYERKELDHRIVVPDAAIAEINDGQAPVAAESVHRHQQHVVGEQVHLARPAAHARMAGFFQARIEVCVERVHLGQSVAGRAALAACHQQGHVRVYSIAADRSKAVVQRSEAVPRYGQAVHGVQHLVQGCLWVQRIFNNRLLILVEVVVRRRFSAAQFGSGVR